MPTQLPLHICEANASLTKLLCCDILYSKEGNFGLLISKLGLHLKNRKTAIIPATKRQCVTGIVVNERLNISRDYKKTIRQEMYFIKKFGLNGHLNKMGISDKESYLLSLRGKVAYVLQTVPDSDEFAEYKEILSSIKP